MALILIIGTITRFVECSGGHWSVPDATGDKVYPLIMEARPVLTARSGKEAIEIYEKNKQRIDIVILDMIHAAIRFKITEVRPIVDMET